MYYQDFDREFPARCLKLIGSPKQFHHMTAATSQHFAATIHRRSGNLECSNLLAIGCALLCTHVDREQVKRGLPHITRDLQNGPSARVEAFLERQFLDWLRETREQSQMSGPFNPRRFRKVPVVSGSAGLLDSLLDNALELEADPIESRLTARDAIKEMRNALAHGNVWLLSSHELKLAGSFGHSILGYALASTRPEYHQKPCKKCGQSTESPVPGEYHASGLVISTLDFFFVLREWAQCLVDQHVDRKDGMLLVLSDHH